MKFLQLLVLAAVATIVVPQTASVWLSSSAISASTNFVNLRNYDFDNSKCSIVFFE